MKIFNKKGFTLIELMIVIAIIGILSAIILATFSTAKSQSRDTKRVSDLAQIQLALAGYFDRCGQYPAPVNYANSQIHENEGIINNSMLTETSASCPSGITLGTFIESIPLPPNSSSGEVYIYYTDQASDDYFLQTTLENSNTASNNSLPSTPSWYTQSGIWLSSAYDPVLPACTQTATAYCVGPK